MCVCGTGGGGGGEARINVYGDACIHIHVYTLTNVVYCLATQILGPISRCVKSKTDQKVAKIK